MVDPVPYKEFRRRMRAMDVLEEAEYPGARVFSQYRMGLGLNNFRSIPYHGDDELVSPPTIEAALAEFGFTPGDWEWAKERADELDADEEAAE